mmetsp:Transcript_46080/g.73157  ORF Transcript_46080/g.73157 Transcript_46080/m.73157 type:complete len:80 (+) Transcript_46080:166-405(+)
MKSTHFRSEQSAEFNTLNLDTSATDRPHLSPRGQVVIGYLRSATCIGGEALRLEAASSGPGVGLPALCFDPAGNYSAIP